MPTPYTLHNMWHDKKLREREKKKIIIIKVPMGKQ